MEKKSYLVLIKMATASLTVPENISFQFHKQFSNHCDHSKNRACISPQVVCKTIKIDKSGAMNSPEYAAMQDITASIN